MVDNSPIWSDSKTIDARELSTKDGAAELATMIECYWRKRGKNVKCRLEAIDGGLANRAYFWAVRSNMIGGMPR